MKRVLFVNELSDIAGTEILLNLIMSHLDRSRYTPLIACPPGPMVERIKQNNIEHIPFTFRLRRLKTGSAKQGGIRILNPFAFGQKVVESFAIAQLIRNHQIDIIHTNSLSAHLVGLLAAKQTGVPIVWHIHTHLMGLLYKFALPDAIIFVSDFVMRTAFPKGTPLLARRIYNGIDLTVFNPDIAPPNDIRVEFNIRPDQPLVVMIGYLDPIKGQHELLQAWPEITAAYPGARLLLVGKVIKSEAEDYAAQLKATVNDLGLSQSVIFTGYRADIASILKAIDVYVSFTLNDTLSMMVIEAMTMRTAIVGANSGGLPELIIPGESGLLVNKGDISGLAAAVKTLLGDADLRTRFGEAARRRALAQFNIEQCVTNIQEVYDGLLVTT